MHGGPQDPEPKFLMDTKEAATQLCIQKWNEIGKFSANHLLAVFHNHILQLKIISRFFNTSYSEPLQLSLSLFGDFTNLMVFIQTMVVKGLLMRHKNN